MTTTQVLVGNIVNKVLKKVIISKGSNKNNLPPGVMEELITILGEERAREIMEKHNYNFSAATRIIMWTNIIKTIKKFFRHLKHLFFG